jgi:uncharacterized protein
MTKLNLGFGALAVCVAAGFFAAAAQESNSREKRSMHRAIIEVTAGSADHWDSVLNNVENLQKALGPEATEIEVVVHGKALSMLRKDNTAQGSRLSRIAGTGVKFAACENTMRRMKVQLSDLFEFAVTVNSGVAEVVRKQGDGWAYIKAGS